MKYEAERRRFQNSFSEKQWAKVMAHTEFKKAWDAQAKRLKEATHIARPFLPMPPLSGWRARPTGLNRRMLILNRRKRRERRTNACLAGTLRAEIAKAAEARKD